MSLQDANQKRRITLLLICLSSAVLTIILLFKWSDAPNIVKNGFKRNLLPDPFVVCRYSQNLGSNGWYIAGYSQSVIYLGNNNSPDSILMLNYSLSQQKGVNIHTVITGEEDNINIQVDSPYAYINNLNKSRIERYDFNSAKTNWTYSPVNLHFTTYTPISGSSFVLRVIDSGLNKYVLAKISPGSNSIKTANILRPQMDGFLSTDGILQYDPATGRLFYNYFYRNQFYCLDSNLNILFQGKTIDTTSAAKLKISYIKSLKLTTFSAPPITTNVCSCLANGLLYVRSGLLADNDDRRFFGKGSVIDVYNQLDGHYRFSFYVSDLVKSKIKDFRIIGHTLIAMQGAYIGIYPLTF